MIRKSISEKLTNKDGAALITVLVVFLTLVVIITSATYAALGNFKRTVSASNKSSALYIAEAGLHEYDEKMINFFLVNKENIDYDDGFVEAFKDYLLSVGIDADPIKKNYGKVMGYDAHSEITIDYTAEQPDNPNEKRFEIKSKGFVGEESRTVIKGFTIDVVALEIEGDGGLQPGGISLVDPDNDSPLSFPPDSMSGYALDSLVTNKLIKLDGTSVGKMGGPLVTNNEITVGNNTVRVPWEDGVIITSDKLDFDKNISQIHIKAIMFKPKKLVVGGDKEEGFEYEYDYDHTYLNGNAIRTQGVLSTIEYIFIPEGSDINKYFRVNDEISGVMLESIKSMGTKIIRYNPLNLNPYEEEFSPELTTKERNHIFGEDPEGFDLDDASRPKINYRDYFKASFILDNMHDESLVQKNRPKVTLPDIEEYTKHYPIVNHVPFYEYYPGWGARTVIIDGSGQLNFTLEKSNHILDLAKIANEYGSDVLPFESVTLGKGWASDPATIDVGNRKITIVTKELHLKDSIELLSEEDGYLEIVVIGQKNGTLVAGNFTSDLLNVQAPKSSNLRFIVYESETEITLNTKGGHGNTFVGTVFSENLNLNAATAYSGNFISANGKSIVIDNVGASLDSQLIYAPMAHLTLGGGTLKGVIVVGSYTPGNTGTSFIFDPLTAQNLIDEIDHPLFDFGEGSEGGVEIDGSLDFYDVIQEVDE